ncbi:heterokaryon incompatibility protein-domain-containing protein, partial [Podospora conica]
PESALSPTVLDFLRKSLDHCCHKDEGLPNDWPSRMLRITEHGTVALVDFQTDMARQYAALSYCWGSPEELSRHPPLRATAAVVPALRNGIDANQLPRTIEQAVTVCVHLGIQYIWVDALCILQDDPADWEKESTKMATIYSEAMVTIIAASSTSCHSGFLDMDMGGTVLDVPQTSDSSVNMVRRLASNRGFHKDIFGPTPDRAQDPIDSRGWTLQEQVLSTRYIKFTENDVQWECRCNMSCLCTQRPRLSPFVRLGPRQWHDIPGHFNHRKFTLTSDKLRALSGLAKAAQRTTLGDVYLAGMWKMMLLDTKTYTGQLYWRCKAGAPAPCYDIYIAPSFCWASVPSTLTNETMDWGILTSAGEAELIATPVESYLIQLLCKVIDAGTVPLSANDPLGPVTDGFLTLHAPLVPCMISSLDGKDFDVTSTSAFDFSVDPFFCRFDCVVAQVEVPGGGFTVTRSRHRQAFDATEATIALLRTVSEENEIGSPTVGVEGLILGRCVGRDGYQRLGYIQIKPPGDIDAIDWSEREREITVF